MKRFSEIRKRLLRQMAFSLFVMTVLPLTTRSAGNGAQDVPTATVTAGTLHSDQIPEPGKCTDPKVVSNS